MAEDDELPAEEAGGETEAASAWNILQSPAGKLVAAAGGGFVHSIGVPTTVYSLYLST